VKLRYFLLIYYDDDRQKFNVTGPISDDEDVTEKTVSFQRQGRRYRISTTNSETDKGKVPSVQKVIDQGVEGYTYDSDLKW